ncbi:MAG: class II aldolase/adducin family protein [Burkholderiales bacterium]|jgi:L-fuculose-phosphate aldolase/L-ribulose-5-phosphate 4-epimerase|nr:class II aldolase/adducin family protein [Burkholderiales bacterium]
MATVTAYAADALAIAAAHELMAIARRAFEVGLQTGTGGNISIRVGTRSEVVIKPSGVGLVECNEDNLLIVDLAGNILKGTSKPSKDMDFHLGIYRVRDDVGGIVHVHSPWATAWASSGREMPLSTVHARDKLKRVPVIATQPGGGAQRAEEIVAEFRDPGLRAALLAHHGAVGVGRTLLDAEHVAELVEETAQVTAMARLLAAVPG